LPLDDRPAATVLAQRRATAVAAGQPHLADVTEGGREIREHLAAAPVLLLRGAVRGQPDAGDEQQQRDAR
jgi:hypothetical protein